MWLKYTIKHNNVEVEGSDQLQSIKITNGSTTKTIINPTEITLNCKGKVAANNIVIGDKTLNCKGKIMADNVTINVEKGYTPPAVGDIVEVELGIKDYNNEGSRNWYRVMEVNTDDTRQVKLMSLYDSNTYNVWRSDGETTTIGNITVPNYEGSIIDSFCQSIYNELDNNIKKIIIPQNMYLDAIYELYDGNSFTYTRYTKSTPISRYIHVLSMEELRSALNTTYNALDGTSGTYVDIGQYLYNNPGASTYMHFSTSGYYKYQSSDETSERMDTFCSTIYGNCSMFGGYPTRAALVKYVLTIDLSKINFSIITDTSESWLLNTNITTFENDYVYGNNFTVNGTTCYSIEIYNSNITASPSDGSSTIYLYKNGVCQGNFILKFSAPVSGDTRTTIKKYFTLQ